MSKNFMNPNPQCNFCEKDAEYDFVTIFHGKWAYGCKECFEKYNLIGLGVGKGSELFGIAHPNRKQADGREVPKRDY